MRRRRRSMFMPKKRHRKRFVVIPLLLAVMCFLGYVAYRDVFAGGRKAVSAVPVYIPVGTKKAEVADILKDNGIILYPAAFNSFSFFIRDSYVYGGHILSTDMTYFEITRAITNHSNESIIAVNVTPGSTLSDIAEITQTELNIPKEELLQTAAELASGIEYIEKSGRTAKKLEGYLYPDVYNFTAGVGAAEVLQSMVNKFNANFTKKEHNRCEELGLTVDQAVTLASILQAECENAEEMAVMSKELHRKLSEGVPLQSQKVMVYMLGKDGDFSESDYHVPSPYNTYINSGLPAGPICSPSAEAINASLYF